MSIEQVLFEHNLVLGMRHGGERCWDIQVIEAPPALDLVLLDEQGRAVKCTRYSLPASPSVEAILAAHQAAAQAASAWAD